MNKSAKLPKKLTGKAAGFLDDPALQRLFDVIEKAGGEIRVNGGAVRNALMGQSIDPANAVDLSTTLLPERVVEVLEQAGNKAVPTGIEHGTITAVIEGAAFEITTLREDIETDGRHAVVSFGTDWKADARRRDFTMNALYCERDGTLHDPLGGYGDLMAGTVRFIGDPDERIAEDWLRMLRFFRFFAWYGSGRPDAEGLKACARRKQELGALSAERLWQETKKMLAAPDPSRALLWMRQSGVLTALLPETEKWGIDAVHGLTASETQHGWEPDALLRLMAIIPPRLEIIEGLAKRLKLSNDERDRLIAWATASSLQLDTSEATRAAIYQHGANAISDKLKLAVAAQSEDTGRKDLAGLLEIAENWSPPPFPVSGKDLAELGYRPGPGMGEQLTALEKRWVASDFTLTRGELLSLARKP